MVVKFIELDLCINFQEIREKIMKKTQMIWCAMLLIIIAKGQNLCENCYYGNSTTFYCNTGICQSFLWPYPDLPAELQCRSTSQKNCYYFDGVYENTKLFKFTACNFSMPECATCNQPRYCFSCNIGSVLYLSDLEYQEKSCRNCNDAIPGCQICGKFDSCDQCSNQFILSGGLCYEKDGKTLAGANSQTAILIGIQVSVITISVICFIILMIIIHALNIWKINTWKKQKKYQKLLQDN